MTLPVGPCPRCGRLYQIKPDYAGSFMLACGCPPLQTYTTNNTNPPPNTPALREGK